MGFACAVCGGYEGLAVHEMTPGKNRMRGFGVRAAWLPACSNCNCNVLTSKADWPLPKQLALKLLIDPAWFSLFEIRKILAPEGAKTFPVVVTEEDVLVWMRNLLIERKVA